jgi:hypothetical protein
MLLCGFHHLKLANIDFDVDFKKVVYYFVRACTDITKFGVVLDACIHSCNLFFTNSYVEFIQRQMNKIAHGLT